MKRINLHSSLAGVPFRFLRREDELAGYNVPKSSQAKGTKVPHGGLLRTMSEFKEGRLLTIKEVESRIAEEKVRHAYLSRRERELLVSMLSDDPTVQSEMRELLATDESSTDDDDESIEDVEIAIVDVDAQTVVDSEHTWGTHRTAELGTDDEVSEPGTNSVPHSARDTALSSSREATSARDTSALLAPPTEKLPESNRSNLHSHADTIGSAAGTDRSGVSNISVEDIMQTMQKDDAALARKFWRPPMRVREVVDIPDELRAGLGLTPRSPPAQSAAVPPIRMSIKSTRMQMHEQAMAKSRAKTTKGTPGAAATVPAGDSTDRELRRRSREGSTTSTRLSLELLPSSQYFKQYLVDRNLPVPKFLARVPLSQPKRRQSMFYGAPEHTPLQRAAATMNQQSMLSDDEEGDSAAPAI
eukprot:TRINITY_DN12845_c0_g1_i1.p1 TRINITY_DN12845_c0_g1~~TRINITY_DN12845_c0_g1_i1.p1  ORF type:complete len:415 (-),score=76.19 TRINITY_DN12845_c0_g1_i1:45-1289(-)